MSSGEEITKIESFVAAVGPFGLYQKSFMVLLQANAFFVSLTWLTMPFAILEPTPICNDYGQRSELPKCYTDIQASNCTNFSMELHDDFFSVRAEWPQLIVSGCHGSMDSMLSFISTEELVGGLVFIVFGSLSDLFGRRFMILAGMFLVAVFTLAGGLAGSPTQLACFVMAVTIARSMMGTAVPSLASEATLGRYRLSVSIAMTWALAHPVVALVAYLTASWRAMLVTAACAAVPVWLGFLYFGESPRWLLVRKRYTDAAAVLNRMARLNGKQVRFSGDKLREELEPLQPKFHADTDLLNWFHDLKSIKHVLRHKQLMLYLLFVLWHYLTSGAVSMNYVINAGEFKMNTYLSIACVGLFRLWTPFAVIGADLYMKRFDRRFFMFGSFLLVLAPQTVGCITSICAEYVKDETALRHLNHSTAVMAFLSTGMSYGLLFFAISQVTTEVFPTVSRSGAISMIGIASTIGGALGPQMKHLSEAWVPSPFVLAEACLFISLLLAVKVVPETKNKPLPDRFDDIALVFNKTPNQGGLAAMVEQEDVATSL